MKLAVTFLALVAVVAAKNINFEDVIDLENISAYDYLEKVGLPLANELREAESRIINGQPAGSGQFPYQAGLIVDFPAGQGACGGVLVAPTKTLTAAHCWFDGRNQGFRVTVVLGTTFLFSGGIRLQTSAVVMHGSWTPSLVRNDIAMITLPSAVGISSVTNYAILPSGSQLNENFAGSTGTASGFGITSNSGSIGNDQFLSFINVPIITNTVCRLTFPLLVQSSNICTSSASGMSPCRGDSGGPLVVQRNGPLLVGLTSFGSPRGCEAGAPAVFVRITSYSSWINGQM